MIWTAVAGLYLFLQVGLASETRWDCVPVYPFKDQYWCDLTCNQESGDGCQTTYSEYCNCQDTSPTSSATPSPVTQSISLSATISVSISLSATSSISASASASSTHTPSNIPHCLAHYAIEQSWCVSTCDVNPDRQNCCYAHAWGFDIATLDPNDPFWPLSDCHCLCPIRTPSTSKTPSISSSITASPSHTPSYSRTPTRSISRTVSESTKYDCSAKPSIPVAPGYCYQSCRDINDEGYNQETCYRLCNCQMPSRSNTGSITPSHTRQPDSPTPTRSHTPSPSQTALPPGPKPREWHPWMGSARKTEAILCLLVSLVFSMTLL